MKKTSLRCICQKHICKFFVLLQDTLTCSPQEAVNWHNFNHFVILIQFALIIHRACLPDIVNIFMFHALCASRNIICTCYININIILKKRQLDCNCWLSILIKKNQKATNAHDSQWLAMWHFPKFSSFLYFVTEYIQQY